ncbi:MAG: BamA/TamA family outer membrane protein [Labilithrix sp.]|nr:BamA/TamA family outer membrane protein [Labilithrix sp.]MCW5814908.1 BamA/TamA family outer membrane protein [Labilithrix sp.]
MKRWLGASLLSCMIATRASAQSTTPAKHSKYEDESLDQAIARFGSALELEPEGKILEGVDVVPLEVIEARDPAPGLLNMFHVTTRTGVIRREVLLKIGEPYRQYLVDDTTRVLRTFRQLSLVIATPTKGSAPDRVRLLIVTKDVWSLRAQSDFGVGPKGIDRLRIEPIERNVFGTFDSVFGRFELFPATIMFGGGLYVPRLAARALYFAADGNVILNRDHGHVEGSYGSAVVRQPQLSARQPWYWAMSTAWRNEIRRRYLNAEVATFDAPSTPEIERFPDAYRARSFTQNGQLTRSYGLARKNDLVVGAEVNVREYQGYDPRFHGAAFAADYRRLRTPTSDTRAAPYVEAKFYESRFMRTHDLDTLGLGEDYRLGYDVTLRAYPVLRALGSTRSFLGLSAYAQYSVRLGKDGLGRVTAETLVEAQTSDLPVRVHAGNAQLYSPRFFLGRVVVDGLAIVRPANYLNIRSTVGGESRLRGQPSGVLLGANLVAVSTELRTRPLHVLASQLGGALFFDVADATDGWPLRPKSSAGVGLRLVLPQLDRQVIRFDVGFPIQRAEGAGPIGFYFALEQAFAARTPDGWNSLANPIGTGALGQ